MPQDNRSKSPKPDVRFADWMAARRDFPHGTPVRQRYTILSAPRSGSTLLGECLRQLGSAGDPLEYLSPSFLDAFRASAPERQEASWTDVLRYMETRRTSRNGVFGIKLHFHQFNRTFGPAIDTDGADWLSRQGLLIRLYRKDRLSQAVSRMKAEATDQWHSTDRRLHPFAFQGSAAEFLTLVSNLHWVARAELLWVQFCRKHSLRTIDLAYEELRDNLRPTIGRLLAQLGVPNTSSQLSTVPLQQLADEQSAQIRAELLAYVIGERDALA